MSNWWESDPLAGQDWWSADKEIGSASWPAGSDVATIRAAINQIPEGPARQAAMRQWADQYVANERAGGGVVQGAGDVVRNLARGTPVGSWLDEANARTNSALNAVTGGYAGAPYDESVAYQRAVDRALDKSAPITSTVTQIVGGVASAPLSPILNVARGAAMAPQIVRGIATGAAYGAGYGSGEGETWKDGGKNALVGAGIGGGIGAAAPVVARGVSNAVGYVADKFKGVPADLASYHRGASDRVARAMGDDSLTPSTYTQRVADLGPEGMLADMGPNLSAQAGGIANQPGAGQTTLANALDARRMAAPGRVQSTLDQNLGPRLDLVEAEQKIRSHYGKLADPLYDQFRNTPVPFTRELEAVQEVLKHKPDVLKKARDFSVLSGQNRPEQFFAQFADDGSVAAVTRVPNANEWDLIKRALDDHAKNAKPGTFEQSVYRDLAGRVRDSVDAAINPNNPQQSIYAKARGTSGEGIGLRNAMDEGGAAFSRGVHPDQMRADMKKLSAAERIAYALGARGQVSDIMGNSATSFGANGDTAARKALGSDFAREKLGLIAGDTSAENIINRLDAETAFERTRQGVRQNSATASRLKAQDEFPSGTANTVPKELGNRSLASMLLMELPYRAINAATGGALNERRANIAADAAKILSANDIKRDTLARALLDYQSGRALTKSGKDAIEKLLLLGGRGSQAATINPYAN